MKRSTILLSVVVVVLLALLLGFIFLTFIITCNDCGGDMNISATRQAIQATNQQVDISLTGTAAAKTASAVSP